MGVHHSPRIIEVPFYARISKPERIFSGFLTVIVRNANDGDEDTDDFVTRYDRNHTNAKTRNIDDAGPFLVDVDPDLATTINAAGNLLLEANGGSNDLNSTLLTATTTDHEWLNIDAGDKTGIAGSASGDGSLTFTPQSTSGDEGIKINRTTSLGTANANWDKWCWTTRPGRRYRVRVNAYMSAGVDSADNFYIKVIFEDSTSFLSTATTAATFGTNAAGTDKDHDFVIPADTNLDEIQFYQLDPDDASTWTINSIELFEIQDRGRATFGQSIGDYDVLVYHVTGCCHLSSALQPYQESGAKGYYSTAELAGYPDTTGAPSGTPTWAKYIDHPACQNFVKFTLISRHNNAYDHQEWNSAVHHPTMTGGLGDDHTGVYVWQPEDNVAYWEYGGIASAPNAGDQHPCSIVDRDVYLNISSQAADSQTGTRGLLRQREEIFSTASASHRHVGGFDRSLATIGEDMRSGIAHVGTSGILGNNTFFAPVHGVDIYATHRFVLTKYTASVAVQDYSGSGGTDRGVLTRVSAHDITFWQLVVNVKLLAFNSSAAVATANDYEFFKNRININYQPSGETQNMIFSATAHTT